MQEMETMTIGDYTSILKRRIGYLLVPAAAVIFLAVLVAFLLPASYRSEATILIEAQEVPSEFVASTVTSYAEQRIQTIRQQIMSFSSLLKIIQDYDLYPEMKDNSTTEEIVEQMREDTTMMPVSAEIVDPRTGRPATATIAFTLSYEGKNPQKVLRVANVLASLYLEKNLEERVQQTEETSTFLEAEISKIKKELAATDAKIAAFKKDHINELPEMLQVNMQSYNNIDRGIENAYQQMRSLKEREGYLDAQLVSVEPYLQNEEQTASRKRLEELKVQLVALTKRFAPEYPDVKKTKAEILDLEETLTDLKKSRKGPPDNPAYVTLKAQLASVRAEIRSLQQQIDKLKADATQYQSRIAASPNVEEAYNELMVARESTQAKYNDLMNKLMEARVAHGLETEQKGERFTLIDAPRLPEKPFKPNRLAIILIGLILGLGAGVGTAALAEFSDDRLYSKEALVRATSIPVLAGIPVILTQKDIARNRNKRIVMAGGTIALVLAGLAVIHFAVMDLDLLWLKIVRQF